MCERAGVQVGIALKRHADQVCNGVLCRLLLILIGRTRPRRISWDLPAVSCQPDAEGPQYRKELREVRSSAPAKAISIGRGAGHPHWQRKYSPEVKGPTVKSDRVGREAKAWNRQNPYLGRNFVCRIFGAVVLDSMIPALT